jgi:hypothetical protein
MERISRYLEDQNHPVTTGNIKTNVKGKNEYLLVALDRLFEEGTRRPHEEPAKTPATTNRPNRTETIQEPDSLAHISNR